MIGTMSHIVSKFIKSYFHYSMKRYGLPYMGSKNKIAKWVVGCLPAAPHFYDLFCGGGAVTHAAIFKSASLIVINANYSCYENKFYFIFYVYINTSFFYP